MYFALAWGSVTWKFRASFLNENYREGIIMKSMEEQFKEVGVVPVVVLNDAKDALPLAEALVEGGLTVTN